LRLTLPVAHPEDLARPADDLPANLNRSSAHWGLIPYWCKDAGGGRKPINAKGETVASLPSFREAYRRRRCVLPIDNFFEWKAIKGERAKQPFAIGMKSGKPFALAGIWGNWQKPGSDEWVRSFAIITTTANELVSDIQPWRILTGGPAGAAPFRVQLLCASEAVRDALLAHLAGHGVFAPVHWRQDSTISGRNVLTLGILHETVLRWLPQPESVVVQAATFSHQRWVMTSTRSC